MLSDIFRIIPRLCAGYSTMYRLTLLTSPEGNLQTPTLDPKFFYANKGCNSGDLTYKCSIPIHPYFYNLSALIKTIQQLVPCICNTSQLDISNINCCVGILEKRNKFCQFIQQVEYIQSSTRSSIFISMNSRKTG